MRADSRRGPDEISAGQAGRLLDQIRPSGPVAQARCELAAELLADIRHLDAQRREARKKPAAADRPPQPAPPATPAGHPQHLPRGRPGGRWQDRSVMMTGRAWSLCGDLAGVGTAMITTRTVPAPLPAHNRRVAHCPPSGRTLPTPWRRGAQLISLSCGSSGPAHTARPSDPSAPR